MRDVMVTAGWLAAKLAKMCWPINKAHHYGEREYQFHFSLFFTFSKLHAIRRWSDWNSSDCNWLVLCTSKISMKESSSLIYLATLLNVKDWIDQEKERNACVHLALIWGFPHGPPFVINLRSNSHIQLRLVYSLSKYANVCICLAWVPGVFPELCFLCTFRWLAGRVQSTCSHHNGVSLAWAVTHKNFPTLHFFFF